MPESNELHVVIRNDDYVKLLEKQREEAIQRAEDWKKKYQHLDAKYADVQHVNIELIDKLKAYGIKYRPGADISTWEHGI